MLTNVEVEIRHNKSAICDSFFPFAESLELCGGFQSLWGCTCLIGKIQFSLTHALLGDFFTSFSSSTHFPGRRNDSINTADNFLPEDSLFRDVLHYISITTEHDMKTKFPLIYIYIYIYAFSRRFYPKRLTLHSSYSNGSSVLLNYVPFSVKKDQMHQNSVKGFNSLPAVWYCLQTNNQRIWWCALTWYCKY